MTHPSDDLSDEIQEIDIPDPPAPVSDDAIDRALAELRAFWTEEHENVARILRRAVRQPHPQPISTKDIRDLMAKFGMPAWQHPQNMGVFLRSHLGLVKEKKTGKGGGRFLLPSTEELEQAIARLKGGRP